MSFLEFLDPFALLLHNFVHGDLNLFLLVLEFLFVFEGDFFEHGLDVGLPEPAVFFLQLSLPVLNLILDLLCFDKLVDFCEFLLFVPEVLEFLVRGEGEGQDLLDLLPELCLKII
jgi:hypothetical protein